MRPPASRQRRARPLHTRGQSEMIGVVLILAITITGSALVVAFGSSALSDAERDSRIGSVEHAMTQFDSRTSLVGLGGSGVQTVDLGSGGPDSEVRVAADHGWLRVEVVNATTEEVELEVMNQSLGVVEYRDGDATVAYQGGGVWKTTSGGASMVSPPEFHYRDQTLTLPLVVVEGDASSSGRLEIAKNGTPESKFPVAGQADRMNPLTEGKINVTVQSTYYRAWGRFFEDRTGGQVAYDDANRTVTITLVVPGNRPPVTSALASTSAEEMVIKGSGGGSESSFTDSYNSSKGDYDSSKTRNGTVLTTGGVEMSGGAEIRGDLVSGSGTVRLGSKNAKITGNLSYGGSTDVHDQATVGGWIADNGSVPEIDHVGGLVDRKVEEIETSNDNDAEPNVTDDGELDSSRTEWELPAGQYYLDELDLDSETLVLNTSDGDVVLAVDGDVTFDGSSVRVENPEGGEVNVYMGGDDLTVSDADVSVPGDVSSKLWIYGPPETSATFDSHATFVGILYAPDSDTRQGEVVVDSQAEVFGALVGGRTTLQSGGTVHFDQSLEAVEEPVPGSTNSPKLTYLHVTVNRVVVTSP